MFTFTLVLTTGVAFLTLQFNTKVACEDALDKLTKTSDSMMVGACIEGVKNIGK